MPETDFDREREWWDAKAAKEESDALDERINRALRWREIERHLDGVETIVDMGGGTGAFSIPLAKRGFRVTHFDLSPQMHIAQTKAEGIVNLEIVQGKASDLRQFPDRAFDLVLNMDGAVSFSGAQAVDAIRESCRIARKKVILTVSHQARMAANWVSSSLVTTGQLIAAVDAMFERGEWHQGQFPDNKLLSEGLTQNYLGTLKAFLPGELRRILQDRGMQVLRCGGLGSLAGLCSKEALQRAMAGGSVFETFLSLCERFDQEVLPEGPGTYLRAGLIAVCRRSSG